MEISPHRIRVYESCKAGFVYQYLILPRIKSKDTEKITRKGSVFHEIAQSGIDRGNLYNDTPSDKRNILSWLDRLKSRPYYEYPAETELRLSTRIGVAGSLLGIIDRLYHIDGKWVIVDYKTTEMPDPMKDFRQLTMYALLLWKSRRVAPENITLHLDYIAADAQFSESVSMETLVEAEQYVSRILKNMHGLISDFERHRDISKIDHTVGECSFCPMKGKCLAYRSVTEPSFPDLTDTLDIIRQVAQMDNLKKLYDERSKALKAALLCRGESGDDAVSKYCTIVRSESTVYPTEAVLSALIPHIVEMMAQKVRYGSLIPTGELADLLIDSIRELLPDDVSHASVPEKYHSIVERTRRTVPKSPFIKLKAKEVACLQ